MENATKALYMVAGVLIGLLVLAAFILVFRKGGQTLETIDNRKASEAIAEYNSKLIIYNRDNNNIFDVITACNMAFDINTKNMFDSINGLGIQIDIDGTKYSLQRGDDLQVKGEIGGKKLTSFINVNIEGKTLGEIEKIEETKDDIKQTIHEYCHTFTGQVEYDSTGRINQINFILNP